MADAIIVCKTEKCHGRSYRRGLCSKHYDEFRKSGLPPAPPITTRLWERVDCSGGSDACWIWGGAKNDKGYGQIREQRKVHYVHRIALSSVTDAPPGKMNALHKCDNPSCCNPNHLFWGTQKDNMADCAAKGRINPSKGELSGRAILSEKDVIDIRKMASRGMSDAILGKRFGVHRRTIRSVVMGENWKHIPYLS